MMKIECPECSKSFIWTDDMPLSGKCPREDCGWRYNVHEQLRKNVSHKIVVMQAAVLCPNCREPIASRWSICKGCGNIVCGSQSFEKKHLVILIALLLMIISLIYRYIS
jgi:hypothetical protein